MLQPLDARAAAPTLIASGLTHRFPDDRLGLDALSVRVGAGEIYCVLGADDAGRTQVLHAFLGLSRPAAGVVAVEGIDIQAQPEEARRRLAYVGRGTRLCASLTARQNIQFFAALATSGAAPSRAACYDAMRRVGIPERAFEQRGRRLDAFTTISVWLAMAWLRGCRGLLLDEPTLHLDLYASAAVQDTLLEFRDAGAALLIGTADVFLAGRLADRIGFLKEGRTTLELSRAELAGRSLPEIYLEVMGRPMTPALRPAPLARR
jgi:ABC-2 type transport system ATP-binding protein